MKTIQIALLTLCFALASFSAHATNGDDENVNQKLRTKVVSLVGKSHMDAVHLKKDTQASVKFIVTKYNEILVLSVKTDHRLMDEYVKERLNYKRINIPGVTKMVPYSIKITFRPDTDV